MRRAPRLPAEELQPYVLELPAEVAPLDWLALFGNDHPVEVEVGCGKGLFLLTAALANPDVNYLGIEVERKYQLYTATRLAKRGLTNARVACADARLVFRDRIPSASVRRVHVYFPDPWWKKRHHKRRVFTPEFAAQVARVLVPGGELLLATDVADYATMVRETAAALPALVPLPPPPEHQAEHDLDYLTNFERKARQQGREVHRVAYRRAAS